MTHPHPELDWTVSAATPAMSLAGGTLHFERGERVLDVALDLGYESPSAFAAMFRKALGEPPSAFAARGAASA